MSKYAPANEQALKPYVVWKGWTSNSHVVYGLNLQDALRRAFGEFGAKAGNGRRATPDDLSGITHYMKLGMVRAWCGTVPVVAYDDWTKITCPDCLALGPRENSDEVVS